MYWNIYKNTTPKDIVTGTGFQENKPFETSHLFVSFSSILTSSRNVTLSIHFTMKRKTFLKNILNSPSKCLDPTKRVFDYLQKRIEILTLFECITPRKYFWQHERCSPVQNLNHNSKFKNKRTILQHDVWVLAMSRC